MASVGVALLGHLEAKGCSKSHRETVESHLRVHLVPFFEGRSLDRITEDDVQYVGIDWATRRARWCAVTPAGAVIDEG